MFGFMKPAAFKEVTMPKDQVDKTYKNNRIQVLFAVWIGYALFYFTRNTFKSIMPAMMEDLSITRAELGFLSTIFYIVYGSSRFISGIMSDKSNPRFFMGFGLIITGVLNILFGMSSSVFVFAIVWGLNAFFQGFGWPPCTKVLTTWFSKNERGWWWSVVNTSHNVGGALIPLLAGFIAVKYSWRLGMIVPGLIGIVGGFFIMIVLRDRPETMGLPPVGEWRNDEQELQQVKASGKNMSTWEILKKYIFTNPYIWLLAISYVLVYIVRIGMNDWSNMYLMESRGVDLVVANSAITVFEVGGFIGTLVAGWGSDKLFKGNRVPMNLIYMAGITLSVAALYFIAPNNQVLLAMIYFFIGFFIFGPQMLTGMAAAEFAHKESAGTATGFIGLFGYLGAALTGAPLAFIIDKFGWNTFFTLILIASVLSAIIILPLMKKPKKQHV